MLATVGCSNQQFKHDLLDKKHSTSNSKQNNTLWLIIFVFFFLKEVYSLLRDIYRFSLFLRVLGAFYVYFCFIIYFYLFYLLTELFSLNSFLLFLYIHSCLFIVLMFLLLFLYIYFLLTLTIILFCIAVVFSSSFVQCKQFE